MHPSSYRMKRTWFGKPEVAAAAAVEIVAAVASVESGAAEAPCHRNRDKGFPYFGFS